MTQPLNHMDLAQLMEDARVSSNSLDSIADSLAIIADKVKTKEDVPSATERGVETKDAGTALHDVTVHVAIGNSDNALSQEDWAEFYGMVSRLLQGWSAIEVIYGEWISSPVSPYQNACWGFKRPNNYMELMEALAIICRDFKQNDIAWTEGITDMITPFGLGG